MVYLLTHTHILFFSISLCFIFSKVFFSFPSLLCLLQFAEYYTVYVSEGNTCVRGRGPSSFNQFGIWTVSFKCLDNKKC